MSTLNVTNLPTQEPRMSTAWVNFNGTGTVAIRDQFNVSSITDNGTGNYTINFTTALADTNYSPNLSCSKENIDFGYAEGVNWENNDIKSTTQLQITAFTTTPSSSTLNDKTAIFVSILGGNA